MIKASTPIERKSAKQNKNPSEELKQGLVTSTAQVKTIYIIIAKL